MEQPQKCVDELSTCMQLKRFQVKNTGLSALKLLEDRDALIMRAAQYDKLGKKDLAKKDRAVLKEASESSFKEAAFRSGR
ncbi:hypothetical protein BH11CYA1_BH11CYA1_33160 [soil metagenome]